MSNLDLRQLRYFVAVAEELHFGRAALRLHISQPPLSQQIAALEKTIGTRLFDRNRHKVEITTAGLQFLQDVRHILQETKTVVHRAQAAASGQIGTLQVGLNYTSPLSPVLSSVLRRFSDRYPKVGLELHEYTSDQQLRRLHGKLLDVCFVWPSRDKPPPNIDFHPISKDILRIVMRDNHPLARKRNLTIGDLRDFPIFLTFRQTRTHFYDALISACANAGFDPDIRTQIHQMPFILNYITTGSGIGFLPGFLDRMRPREIIFRPCKFLPPQACSTPLTLAYRAHDPSPLVQNFVKTIQVE